MSKIVKRILILSCLIAILVLPYFVFASSPALIGLKNVGEGQNFIEGPYNPATNKDSMVGIIGTVVSVVLSLLGIIFLILILYAGFNWMTAAGEEEKVTKAKETLTRAIIGLIIIISAYLITIFVFSKLPN